MLDIQSENIQNVADVDPPTSQPYNFDDSDDDDLQLLYPESEAESDHEVQSEAPAPPELISSTPAPSQTAYVFSSPIPPAVAPIVKPVSDFRPTPPPITVLEPPSRPASSQSSHSLDIPLSQTVPIRPPPPTHRRESPPRKRARLADDRTPLEKTLVSRPAYPLNYDAASNSYNGSFRNYSVEKNVISIHNSDGSAAHRPPPDKGYEVLNLNDYSNVEWRKTIGGFIAGCLFAKANQLPERPDDPPWTLGDFPPGYVLWRRTQAREPTQTNPSKTRADIYLYGSKRFASRAEFAPHALWLMRGSVPGTCACKYCSNWSQKAITAMMEDTVIAARTEPSARRSQSPLKPVPASPVKRILAPTSIPTVGIFPASTVPPLPVSNDAEFLRALKRPRETSPNIEKVAPPAPVPKVEEDELADDML